MELRTTAGTIKSTTRSKVKPMIISGYAVMWDKWSKKISENGIEFYERIMKGSFIESLKAKDQIALFEHNQNQYLGSVKEKTLFLEEDEIGLSFKIVLPDNNLGKIVYSHVKRGKLKHVSFSFNATDKEQSWETKVDKTYRTIKNARLLEISPVYIPAYTDSVVVEGDKRTVLFGKEISKEIKKMQLIKKINETLNS